MNYPDATTPWLSSEEMCAAHAERNHRGFRRYDQDPAFRKACEAKTILGYQHDGAETETVRLPGYTAQPGEMEARQELRVLEDQLHGLQVQAAQQEKAQVVSLRIGQNIDPANPVKPFSTREDMVEALQTRDYKQIPEVRAYVEARIKASGFNE